MYIYLTSGGPIWKARPAVRWRPPVYVKVRRRCRWTGRRTFFTARRYSKWYAYAVYTARVLYASCVLYTWCTARTYSPAGINARAVARANCRSFAPGLNNNNTTTTTTKPGRRWRRFGSVSERAGRRRRRREGWESYTGIKRYLVPKVVCVCVCVSGPRDG